MKIRLSPEAIKDLKEIKDYIEQDLSNPTAAQNVIKRIIDDYSRLEITPNIGIPLSNKVTFETDFRFIVSGSYLVFYKTDNEYVSIYRILYSRRDYLRLIFNDIEFEE